MVDKYKGTVELEVLGKKIGFKFGVRSMFLFTSSMGVPFGEGNDALTKAEFDGNMDTVMKYYHCATIAYSRLYGIPELSLDEVYAIIEEVGPDEMAKKLAEAHKIPNSTAPTTGQNQ
jgi:hypothetical protein